MSAIPTPTGEASRLAAVHATGLLDSAREQDFDEIAGLAAKVCGTTMGLVNLVDEKRQWSKASVGAAPGELPREYSFCAQVVAENGEILVVPDAAVDVRFRDNPHVAGEGGIRFCAGVPLRDAAGHALGALCVLDREPRSLDEAARVALIALGRQLDRLVSLRETNRRLEREVVRREELERQLRVSVDGYRDLIENMEDLVQCVGADGRFMYVNRAWQRALGYGEEEVAGLRVFDVIAPECRAHCEATLGRIMAGERVPRVEVTFVSRSGATVRVDGSVNCRFEGGRPISTRGIFRIVGTHAEGAVDTPAGDELTCICGWCRKIRTTHGSWLRFEEFLLESTGSRCTHGVCEDCAAGVMNDLEERLRRERK